MDVTVITPVGTSPLPRLTSSPMGTRPTVTGISPASGPAAGGTTVTITGTNLADDFFTLNDPFGEGATEATGVSGSTIVGSYTDANGVSNGFLYNGSSFTTLDDPLGVGGTYITGVSGSTIVGNYTDANGMSNGFEYTGSFTTIEDSSFTTIDAPGATNGTYITGVSGGTVIGDYAYQNPVSRETIISNFEYIGSSFTDLGGLAFSDTAMGIDDGTIVGYSTPDVFNPPTGGFVYNGSSLTALDEPDSVRSTYLTGISGSTIVGYYRLRTASMKGSSTTDRRSPLWTIRQA